MSVLVTGGAGYIGSHMALRLLDAGEDVVVIDDLSTGHEWAVPAGAELVRGDVGDADLVASVIKSRDVGAVMHFAGSILVFESVADPLGYYLNNTVKSRALVDAALRGGVRQFVFSSTAAVYGSPGLEPIDEDAPLRPESPYGTSKLVSEWMLRDTAAANPQFRYAALRYFNVAGADPQLRSGQSSKISTHLIKIAAEAASGKRASMKMYGDDYPTPDGTCVRDYIHVWDLVEAHYGALEHLRAGGESLVANCGYGHGFSVREVIDAVKRVSGVDFAVEKARRRDGDPAMIVANSDRARRLLGWTPQYDDLDTIIAHAIAWERQLTELGSALGSGDAVSAPDRPSTEDRQP